MPSGAVTADSHVALPVDDREFRDIEQWDMVPFRRMIHYGLAAIMMAHVVYPKVDRQPAGFSRIWIQEVLRGRLNFQGLVFSDDLSMEGAACAGNHCYVAGGCADCIRQVIEYDEAAGSQYSRFSSNN